MTDRIILNSNLVNCFRNSISLSEQDEWFEDLMYSLRADGWGDHKYKDTYLNIEPNSETMQFILSVTSEESLFKNRVIPEDLVDYVNRMIDELNELLQRISICMFPNQSFYYVPKERTFFCRVGSHPEYTQLKIEYM